MAKKVEKKKNNSSQLVVIGTIIFFIVLAGIAIAVAKYHKPYQVADITGMDPHSTGLETAKLTMTEYADYDCIHCHDFAVAVLPDLVKKYGDKVRFVFRNFPLNGEQGDSFGLMLAAEAAGAQGKFAEYQDLIWKNYGSNTAIKLTAYAQQLKLDVPKFTQDINGKTYRSRILQDQNDGIKLGVGGTPTFFLNATRYSGANDITSLSNAIDAALSKL